MLIDSMIRLGRPMIDGGLDPEEVIRQISSITEDRSKKFFEHIIITEVKSGKVCVHPNKTWGSFEKRPERSQKEDFFPDIERAIAAPFIVPSGGNPTAPQGKYSVPSYIVYDSQLRDFQNDDNEMISFLSGRIDRTIGIQFNQELIEDVAEKITGEICKLDLSDQRKHMGLIVILFLDHDSPYTLGADNNNIGNFKKVDRSLIDNEKDIFADLEVIKNRLWQAKIDEGAEKGKKEDARCFFCPKEGKVVSLYNKANLWFTTTWEAPFPSGKSESQLIEGVALCHDCYKYLSYGANVFFKLTRRMDNWLTKELFAPNTSVKARQHYKNSATIYGGILPLPIYDGFFDNPTDRDFFVKNIGQMMVKKKSSSEKNHLYLKTVTGIETFLPEDFLGNNYRLALIYFTGDITRSDIHLLSYIEDILPSTASKLAKITEETYIHARGILQSFPYGLTDQKDDYMERRYNNLPYLLSVAYGSPYLWNSLETVFHRRELSENRFIKNVSSRFAEMSRDLEENIFKINDEAVFYLSFKYFLFRYNHDLCQKKGGEKVRHWQTLLKLAYETPLENIDLELIEEIGFVTGALIRRFANHYYYQTKVGGKGKDFIKHRVMTFGSSLTPDNVWKRGLSKIEEYDRRLDMGIAQDLRDRVAIISMLYMNKRDDIFKCRDEFMAAFWAGYALYSTVKKSIDNSDDQEGI